jgi:hypothetical protein
MRCNRGPDADIPAAATTRRERPVGDEMMSFRGRPGDNA